MNFFGIGGLELVLVMLVAFFVVGPVRLVQGARTARKYMTELRRQREELTQMVEDAVDLEEVREQLNRDGVLDTVRDFSDELNVFKDEARTVGEDVQELKRVVTSIDRPGGYRRIGGADGEDTGSARSTADVSRKRDAERE